MKAQFKYAFLTGRSIRFPVFAATALMMVIFGVFISTIATWVPMKIVAVSLGGVAIAVLFVVNIIGDVAIVRRMYKAPDAYLYALTPTPRWKTLLASVTTMMIMDVVTMAIAIALQVWLSLLLAGGDTMRIVADHIRDNMSATEAMYIIWGVLMLVSFYLFIAMIILFCVTVEKSLLYKVRGAGFIAALLAAACVYVWSLLQLVLIPLGSVSVYAGIGIFVLITLGGWGMFAYALLMLLSAAALFIPTAKLMERKMNI